jgi:hypothetical protein
MPATILQSAESASIAKSIPIGLREIRKTSGFGASPFTDWRDEPVRKIGFVFRRAYRED